MTSGQISIGELTVSPNSSTRAKAEVRVLERENPNSSSIQEDAEIPSHRRGGVKFVIFSMPRTGSTMLTRWLSTHPSVRCLPAIFSDAGWPSRKARGEGALGWIATNIDAEWNSLELRLARPSKLLREIVARSHDKAVIGFKHHMDREQLTELLLESGAGWRKILLTRNNLLAAYSSHKVAALTGQGSAKSGQSVIRATVTFDADEFSRFIRKRRRIYDRARELGQRPWMEIDYIVARTPEGIAQIGRFLDVDPNGFGQQSTAKRNSDDIVSRFSNPDMVRSYLTDNALELWAKEG